MPDATRNFVGLTQQGDDYLMGMSSTIWATATIDGQTDPINLRQWTGTYVSGNGMTYSNAVFKENLDYVFWDQDQYFIFTTLEVTVPNGVPIPAFGWQLLQLEGATYDKPAGYIDTTWASTNQVPRPTPVPVPGLGSFTLNYVGFTQAAQDYLAGLAQLAVTGEVWEYELGIPFTPTKVSLRQWTGYISKGCGTSETQLIKIQEIPNYVIMIGSNAYLFTTLEIGAATNEEYIGNWIRTNAVACPDWYDRTTGRIYEKNVPNSLSLTRATMMPYMILYPRNVNNNLGLN